MGASRKLQGEIDRVLKKVQEGVDVFESIWKKVYDTENANQKEKFEGELKKEIKKLQRHRDQIKTWIQSSEIKDKKVSASYEQALVDARKVIEREMEKFKICEKETKMKAFSKEGLGQQPKTDPKEKAKSETREWLNTVVGELESQIDSFEAEIEGLSIKKGKARPPRLAHLETSITRHKAHIMKVELILRLLDNDQLSPEEVNDVKDFLDDYVERNQDDFDEFSDVDELYSSLPLDKLESLEDLVVIPPGIVKGVGAATATLSVKTSSTAPPTIQPATVTSPVQQGTSILDQVEETASQENNSARTPPPKNSSISSSGPPTPAGTHVISGTIHALTHNVPSPTTSAVPSVPFSARGVIENTVGAQSTYVPSSGKEDDSRKSSSTLPETGLSGLGRGELPNHPSTSIPPSSGTAMQSGGPLGALPSASEAVRRKIPGADELPGGMLQPLVSPLSNRTTIPQAVKGTDGSNSTDSGTVDSSATTGRVFSSSVVPGMQWRPGSPFQNQNEAGQVRGRTEIAPDQREKFLQRFQQVQQQGQSNILGMPPLGGGSHKQFSAQQQHPILQQFNSQSSSVPHQVGLGLGSQAPGFATPSSSSLQQPNSIRQHAPQLISTRPKDTEVDPDKVEGIHQQQSLADDLFEPAVRSELDKHLINEDEMKASFAFDTPGGVAGTLTESSQLSRDTDFSPGQPLQSNPSSGGIGVIGRRSVSDLGAIGNNIGSSSANSLEMHDKSYHLQMLEAAYGNLPQPKDSERAKNYTAINPAMTYPSYPQVQAPIVNNPAFWQRMGADSNNGPDTLFFAFYYQQNTYQQYLAAKELKKQSWRFHRKYNTWFQRHEEPQVTTDEYELGTYVYFDYHITNDEMHHGWCQRIKQEFTFEYNYLEDELVV